MAATTTSLALRAIPPRSYGLDLRDECAAADQPWWLVYAYVGRERGIAAKIETFGVPHILPLAEYDRRTPNGTRRVTHQALFPGYLFVAGWSALEAGLHRVKGINSVSPVADVPRLVSDLARLMDLIDAGAPIGGASQPLQPGEPVRVTLDGGIEFDGLFLRDGGRDRVCVEVRALGRMVEMIVEPWRVERVGNGV